MRKLFKKHHHNYKNKINSFSYDYNDHYTKIGIIVECVNSVELRINKIIANYYISPDKRSIFIDDFMFAGRLRLNDKMKILRSILNRKGIAFDNYNFENWLKIRNMVAHGIPSKNNQGQIMMRFNDSFYDIDREFIDFEKYHERMIAIIEKCE